MSKTDKNAIIALVTLLYIAENYSGIEAKEYQIYIQNVIDSYVPHNPVDEKELESMRQKLFQIDDKISELNYDSSITLTLAIGSMVAEYFLQFVKNPAKVKAWTELLDYCSSHSLINHTLRTQIFSELDKGDVISNIILSAAC